MTMLIFHKCTCQHIFNSLPNTHQGRIYTGMNACSEAHGPIPALLKNTSNALHKLKPEVGDCHVSDSLRVVEAKHTGVPLHYCSTYRAQRSASGLYDLDAFARVAELSARSRSCERRGSHDESDDKGKEAGVHTGWGGCACA
jgi:hypothetical protein